MYCLKSLGWRTVKDWGPHGGLEWLKWFEWLEEVKGYPALVETFCHVHINTKYTIPTNQLNYVEIQDYKPLQTTILSSCILLMESCRCSRAFFSIWACKKTRALWPFQMFFPLVFPSAGFTPWSKNSHERGKGKGKGIVKEGKGKNRKGRGKGKEKERKRKRKRKGRKKGKRTGKKKEKEKGWVKEETGKGKGKGEEKGEEKEKKAVSHTDDFWCQKLSFSLSFCDRSWILFVFLFFWKWLQSSKRSVATTYQAPSLCRTWAITTTNNERKRPKALNNRRMVEKSRTLDFKNLDTDH